MAKEKNILVDEWLEDDNLELLGCWARDYTFKEIADKIGITTESLRIWRNEYEEIGQALKQGRERVDYRVENALLKSALGYKTKETKVTTLMRFGKVIETTREDITKEQAPSVPAIQVWLYNRAPDKWKRNRDTTFDLNEEDATIHVTVTKAAMSGEKRQPDEDDNWLDDVNQSIEITKKEKTPSDEIDTDDNEEDKTNNNTESPNEDDLDYWPDDWDEEYDE